MGELVRLPRVQKNTECSGDAKILHFRKRGPRYPEAAQAVVDRCEAWLDQEANLTLCKELIHVALELDPESFDANYEYARALYFLNEWNAAGAYWLKAARIASNRWEPHFNAGLAKMRCLEYTQAEPLLLRARALNPSEACILNELAYLYRKTSRHDMELDTICSFVHVCTDLSKLERARSRIRELEEGCT